ncbi:EamA family transporter [Lewinellaceae bacterium SD302]|nr:EamA family transporter [Lewinellaceae bacterium SD302]
MNSTSSYLSPGIRHILLAGVFFTLMQAIIKEMTDFHLFQIIFFRSVITAVVATIYLKRRRIPLLGKRRKLLATRAIFGICAMTLFFATIQLIPLGAAVSLKYLSPVFTAVLAVWLLNEKVRTVQWGLFGLAFLGVVLLKGFDVRIAPFALGLGIVGAVFAGLVYVTIRKIGTSEHPLVIINYFMFSATVLSGLAMIPFWKTPSQTEFGTLLLMGVLGYIAQYFMTKAHQIELASRIAPFRYLEVVYSLLLGYLFFKEAYTALSLLGVVLIVGSMMLNVFLKKERRHQM